MSWMRLPTRARHAIALLLVASRIGCCVDSPSLTIPERLVAGGTARATAQLLLYPADALRTLAQTRAGSKTLSDLGAKALMSGAGTTSAFAYGIGALQFAAVSQFTPMFGPLGASAVGAVASCVVSVPQEVIKQRLVTGIYPNFGAAVRTIWASQGVRGFYTGWGPTVSRNVPFVVCTFTTFATLERQLKRKRGESQLDFASSVQLGVASAVAAACLTQPIDVVKTRMMTQAASSAAPYTSVKDCVQTMLRTEGASSFFAGLKQRTVYAGPLWAMQFGLNAWFSDRLRDAKSAPQSPVVPLPER
jgi:solute carrier family 25 (mitochondrial S-adenosylmethionine transporter), member 26